MSRASHISREPPRRPSQDYAALREAETERFREDLRRVAEMVRAA